MNWLSLLLIGILALATWRAYMTGFVRELVSLCVTILAIPVAGVFYDDLFRKLNPIIENKDLCYLVSFLAILVGVIIAGQVAAHLLKRFVSLLNLGAADHKRVEHPRFDSNRRTRGRTRANRFRFYAELFSQLRCDGSR